MDGKEHFWGRSGSAGRALADGQPSCTALLSWMSCACWNYLLHWSINTLGTGLYFMSTTLSMCLLLYFKSINNSGAAAEIKTKHTQSFTSRIFQHRKEGGKNPPQDCAPHLNLAPAFPGCLWLCSCFQLRGFLAGKGMLVLGSHLLCPHPLVCGDTVPGWCHHSRAPLGASRLPSALPPRCLFS